MGACLRMARRHRSLTGTNPAVGTILVKEGVVVGRGTTALGGRPHAEAVALAIAGEKASGSTAYVSLEPCAHHGATPPCARTLIDAGVARVVTAWIDPDKRVDGKGHAMLRDAGIDVLVECLAERASRDLAGYISRKQKSRPHVTLKLAVSADGKLGREGEEVPITGALSRAYVHRMRAEHEGILVGIGTVQSDDPELTCRLPGLFHRSPHRFVLDSEGRTSASSRLVQSSDQTPVTLIVSTQAEVAAHGAVRILRAESVDGHLALPEILEDLAATGLSSLMVEGGAKVAQSFLEAGLVDEIALFQSDKVVGDDGIASPITEASVPQEFALDRSLQLGDDQLTIYYKV